MNPQSFIGACVAVMVLAAASPRPIVVGIDHVPLAVNDLRQAQADFQRLGFVIKPGRHHDDSILNAHIKFTDHTEIELITAKVPVDRLTREYVSFLRGGDGPESFSLFSPDLDSLTTRLTAMRLHPSNDGEIVTFSQAGFAHQLFFADREPSPTDRAEYFMHANGAYHLQAIYVAASSAEQRLLLALGARRDRPPVCAPFASSNEPFAFADGVVFALPPTTETSGARSIVGALVLVHDIHAVRVILQRSHIAYRVTAGCETGTIWVPPSEAHGLWLGFRE